MYDNDNDYVNMNEEREPLTKLLERSKQVIQLLIVHHTDTLTEMPIHDIS